MTAPRIVLFAASFLLLVPAALPLGTADHGDPGRARYILANGLPGPYNFSSSCLDLHRPLTGGKLLLGPFGEQPIPEVRGPEVWVGGACFQVPAGAHAIDVVDDDGRAPAYWWVLVGPSCRTAGQASGPTVVEVPEGCTQIAVSPIAGSASGVITAG